MRKMKKMKIMAALALALLMLAVSLTALADNAAQKLYGQVTDLLFRNHNVTLTLKAEMSLDGAWFKTADVVLKQSGNYGFRQMLLTSPKRDGSERHNGYTIITEGSIYHLMEVYAPGVYRDGTCGTHDTLLRRSPVTEQLITLGSAIASQADLLLGQDAVKEAEDGTMTVELDGNTPALTNYALSELAKFAAGRYYGVDYDGYSADGYSARIEDYATVREGILYTMNDLSVKKVSVTAKTDAAGLLQAAEGTIALNLRTLYNEIHELGITFSAEITDRDSTEVKPFDPEDYGVTLAEGAFTYTYEEGSEAFTVDVLEADELARYGDETLAMWKKTGYPADGYTLNAGYRYTDGRIEIQLKNDGGELLEALFDSDGIPIQIEPSAMPWWGINADEYNYEPDVDAETDSRAKELMTDFLKTFNPRVLATVKSLKLDSTFEADGALYGQYCEDPLDQEDGGVLFLVRLSPELRIEYYTTISNG